jgi:hypothetical protein
VNRIEYTDEGAMFLDAQAGESPNGDAVYVRHLLTELDIAAEMIGRHLGLATDQVRKDLVAIRYQREDAASERQQYGIRAVDSDGRGSR